MEKSDFTNGIQAGSAEEKVKKSIVYLIKQMKEDTYGATKFKFFHSNRSQKTYKKFGGEPPLILNNINYY